MAESLRNLRHTYDVSLLFLFLVLETENPARFARAHVGPKFDVLALAGRGVVVVPQAPIILQTLVHKNYYTAQ